MSEQKWTPGPWRLEIEADWEDREQPQVYVCSPETQCDVTVVATMGEANSIPHERKLADARLIAAAPELLEALKAALERLDTMAKMTGFRSDDKWVWAAQNLASKAIAKAEGK